MAGTIPSSILIVGSGVFGLSTAYALTQREEYANTSITLLDRTEFPAPDGSSIDASRIIRADYDDFAYAQLMNEAAKYWRGDFGAGSYHETGLLIISEDSSEAAGREFLKSRMDNMQKLGLKVGARSDGGDVSVLDNADELQKFMGTGAGEPLGTAAYVNWTSGWAHAEAGMRHFHDLLEQTGRVKFETGEMQSLLFEGNSQVAGVLLTNGEKRTADLTLLATGAWTPKLIDLRGIASATGQVMAYIQITPEEQKRLETKPVILVDSGMFIIPPTGGELKVARHGYGYANLVTIPNPEPEAADKEITVSLPRTKHDDLNMQIPQEGQDALRGFLAQCFPDLADRPWINTRICWYTDTPTGDWLIDYHPKYEGLFVATGGNGHAYKFLPIVGERVVDLLLHQSKDDLGATLRDKWKWPAKRLDEDHIWTHDWRGGEKGMILDEVYIR